MQVNSVAANAAGQSQASNRKAGESSQTDKKDAKKSTQSANTESAKSSSILDKETIEKLKALGAKGMTNFFIAQYQQETLNISFGNFGSQSGIFDLMSSNTSNKAKSILSQVDFASIGYTGKNILSMSKSELNDLISEDGFFGMENTANRIADFVISGAGNDLEKLKKGFEGMKQGFAQAEKIWGNKLPQLSQDTIDKAIEKVSAKIKELGGNAVSINA